MSKIDVQRNAPRTFELCNPCGETRSLFFLGAKVWSLYETEDENKRITPTISYTRNSRGKP